MPLYFIPIVFVGTVIIFGGNEEYGWRGVMQPILEKKLPYPVATLIIGIVWSVWHLPLWFVDGSSQQSLPFLLFAVLAIFLSFFFSAIYKKTKSMFYCCILHGLTNTLMSVFVVKANVILIIGLVILLGYSFYLWYSTTDSNQVER
jgi:membrane protease YdiL (CAAX protease family)